MTEWLCKSKEDQERPFVKYKKIIISTDMKKIKFLV